MESYHIRRREKAITDQREMDEILAGQMYMTVAMCKDGEPYLVPLNYAYDASGKFFTFHCAATGKKMDFLRANPRVWGQVVEDSGYIAGECDHAFRCVMFSGNVEFVEDIGEKRKALYAMVQHAEKALDDERRAFIAESRLLKVAVGRIIVAEMSGKKGPIKRPSVQPASSPQKD